MVNVPVRVPLRSFGVHYTTGAFCSSYFVTAPLFKRIGTEMSSRNPIRRVSRSGCKTYHRQREEFFGERHAERWIGVD